jgi:hypothetical protein
MRSILDIDLDYFNFVENPTAVLEDLLLWAGRPVDFIVEQHSHVLQRWKRRCPAASGFAPSHILHVDEHHDMMDERSRTNIANIMYQAMRTWSHCKVHWLVQQPIDSPAMWLTSATWKSLRRRFSRGPTIPFEWPRPDVVSVCTSPGFLRSDLTTELLEVIQTTKPRNRKERAPNHGSYANAEKASRRYARNHSTIMNQETEYGSGQ